MSTAQRVSRGFHRLGLFLALITLVIGSLITVLVPDWTAPFPANWSFDLVDRQPMPEWTSSDTGDGPIIEVAGTNVRMPSNYYDQPVAQQQDLLNRLIANNWRNKFAKPLAQGLGITLTISLAIYGLMRAIGWVIGGFAAV
jgi:ABC-type dipeptide/oligopeptide/nickel transport system permease subunit